MVHHHSRRRILLALATLPLLTAGCDGNKTRDDDIQVINNANDLKALLNNESNRAILVDVRKAPAFEAGHIPGAINIPVADIYPFDRTLSAAKHIVVYSDGWRYQRADRLSWAAATKLLTLNYRNVHDYRGGLAQWQLEENPIAQ